MADVYAACVGRFYEELAERLVEGATRVFEETGATVEVHDVPGAFELPLAARYCADSGRYAGVACLGAVIRGETDHYDFVCAEAANGIARVALDTGVPCSFGVLTVDDMEQALARTGGGKRHQGEDAAHAGRPVINLYSDTQTRPTEAMRKAIAGAEVADEQRLADPTTNLLQERVAELLGHEAALFLPSGTMCNQISFRLHARPGGDELILDRTAHPIIAEAGGPAANAQLMIHALDGDGGIFTAEQLEGAVRDPENRYLPRSRVVSVEQTTNMGGGRVWPLERIREVLGVARSHGLRAHIDGARLMNAVVASGTSAAEFAGGFDTAWLDFTKGLGAPVGAVLCGSRELIEEAWRLKQQWGGAFRQSGIVAAGCLHALDHHVERLADDHEHARVLADGLAELGCEVIPPETNIVIFAAPDGFMERMSERGVELSGTPDGRVRAVTHLDVDRAGIDAALAAAREALLP